MAQGSNVTGKGAEMTKFNKIIEGLGILHKYPHPYVSIEYYYLFARPGMGDVTEVDSAKLKDLGWKLNAQTNRWSIHTVEAELV